MWNVEWNDGMEYGMEHGMDSPAKMQQPTTYYIIVYRTKA